MQSPIYIDSSKTVLFVSDLHIDSDSRKNVKEIREVIEVENPDFIFVLGDLFSAAFGWMRTEIYDKFDFVDYLRRLNKTGKKAIWIEGNHEFGLKYLKGIDTASEIELNLGSRKIYLAHGDLVDSNIRYLVFRFLTKNRLSLFLSRAIIPCRLLFKISTVIDKKLISAYNDSTAMMREFAKERFEKGFDAVILAHTHKADFYIKGKHCYYNTGEFAEKKEYLLYKDGRFKAKRYTK